MANNLTNESKFTGWGGLKPLLEGKTPYSFFKDKPAQQSSVNSSIVNGPISINKDRPKNSQFNPESKQQPQSTITYSEPNPDFSKSTKKGIKSNLTKMISLQSLNLPFTAGTVDDSFPYGPDTGFNSPVYDIKIQSDGKILVVGDFNYYYYNGDSFYAPYLIRLNSDGSPDFDFQYTFDADDSGYYIDNSVYCVEIQSDGKILVGGSFAYYYANVNHYSPGIMRFNADGSFDTTLFVGDGFNGAVRRIVQQPDNKILAVGDFFTYNNSQYNPNNGPSYWRIIRLNLNGSPDSTFNTGFGFNWDDSGYVYDIALQPDGKIIIGGDFYYFNEANANYIIRLNSDGSRDNTFVIGDGFNDTVNTLGLQSDGKVIVGGYFNDYNNNYLYDGYIVRLDSYGNLDTLFGHGLNDVVWKVKIQSDDKILVGGGMGTFYIDNYNSLSIDELVRFHADCTFDYSFYYGELFNDYVRTIALTSTSEIFVGGEFYFNGNPWVINRFGKLHNAILKYPYTYVVEDCSQPLGSPIYYTVGSMTELSTNSTYSFRKLSNPSVTVCGQINLDEYPSMNIDYEMVSEYTNCNNALDGNAKNAYVVDMLAYGEGYNILVDNKYEVDDILYVDIVFDFIDGPAFIKTAVQIVDFAPIFVGYFESPIIPYQPYESVAEAVTVNGIHYQVKDVCETDSIYHYPLIHKEYYYNTSILLPSFGSVPCKEVTGVLTFAPYYLISGGTEEMFSVVEFDDCDECLTKVGKTGVLDTTLHNNDFNDFVYTMVEQPDGKILVGGNFNTVNGYDTGSLVRLNIDGAIDDTFNTVYCNQPVWDTKTPFADTTSGSIYFDGTPLCLISADTDVSVWDLGTDNLTFEWFQYFTGDLSHLSPTLFDYSNNELRVYFSNGTITVSIDGDGYTYDLNSTIENVWCHIAVTRYYDPEEDVFIWRVFQDGIQIGQFNYNYSFNQGGPLLIGNSTNPYYNRGFKGYITNFRVNNGCAIYTEDFTVPTEPLDPNYTPGNTVLCLLVNNPSDYILDNCDDEIVTNVNSAGNFLNGGFDSYIRAIALQDDGKILVGGNFNYYNNSLAGRIIRLNSDGSIDNNFTYSNEFNGRVRAIAVQQDGKIVVGGDFNYYYDYYCNHIVRLNSDGTPDTTFNVGDGFDGSVYSITLEPPVNVTYDYSSGVVAYTQNILVGGWFNQYNNTDSRGVAKLSYTGELVNSFGVGFNYGEGGNPRVNQILIQEDGKLVIVGGADGGDLVDYKGTHIPRNIVRLTEDVNNSYIIDTSFNVPPFYYSEGGFNNGNALSVTQQSNGKLIVGGNFDNYEDIVLNYTGLNNIVRLKTDGSLDTTFSLGEGFGNQVNKVLLLSNGKLLTGGRYGDPYPTDYLTRLYIGEEYNLYNFTECDGTEGYTYLPSTFTSNGGGNGPFSATSITYEPISTGDLNVIYDGNYDDSNFSIELPVDFDINFLGTNYTSIHVGSNSYLTFGGGSSAHGISPFPGDIPNETGLPGVYLSTRTSGNYCLDSAMWLLYTGTTDGGNTVIVRFEGNDDYDTSQGDTNLVYNFKFYKNQSNYFDLIIEQNQYFCNDDPTGGVSNGVDGDWITTFDSSAGNAYRIGITSETIIKTDLNTTPTFCGIVGDKTNSVIKKGGQGGSMYFDGTNNTTVTVDYNIAMDLDFDSWTIEWFQYFTSPTSCCLRVFDIGSFPNEHVGLSIESGNVLIWLETGSYTYPLNTPVLNTWTHFAITAENIGGNDRTLRIFQDGVQLGSDTTISMDLNNFDGGTMLPLTIGGMGDGTATFQGYITNFRWNKGTCYYTSNFNVPTSPLSVDGSQLLMLATDAGNFVVDSSGNQTINENNVVWSELNPFGTVVNLYNADGQITYDDCESCGLTSYETVITYVRDGINPNKVQKFYMTSEDINSVLTNGPLFTTTMSNIPTIPVYEILKRYK